MNKSEACEFLSVSGRSLARYASQGKIGVIYKKGKRGNVAEYNDEDLQRLREELSQPISIKPTVQREAIPDNVSLAPLSQVGMVSDLLNVIAERLKPSEKPIVSVENKLTLSLVEAAALSGLSQNFLSDAIHAKRLKAAKRGRGWNVKRSDLDAFIRKL